MTAIPASNWSGIASHVSGLTAAAPKVTLTVKKVKAKPVTKNQRIADTIVASAKRHLPGQATAVAAVLADVVAVALGVKLPAASAPVAAPTAPAYKTGVLYVLSKKVSGSSAASGKPVLVTGTHTGLQRVGKNLVAVTLGALAQAKPRVATKKEVTTFFKGTPDSLRLVSGTVADASDLRSLESTILGSR